MIKHTFDAIAKNRSHNIELMEKVTSTNIPASNPTMSVNACSPIQPQTRHLRGMLNARMQTGGPVWVDWSKDRAEMLQDYLKIEIIARD
jgi:hypothetical protein